MRNLITTITILFCGSSLWADSFLFQGGMDAGGSEHGLVCFSSLETTKAVKASKGNIDNEQLEDLTRIEPIDLWVAGMPIGLPPRTPRLQEPLPEETEFAYLERLLAGIERSLPPLGRKIRQAENAFRPHTLKIKWVPISIQMINDSGLQLRVDQMPLCTITMIAWQTVIEGASFLQIDPRLYERMDVSGRAVTWLHEYVYFIARAHGQRDSRATRKLVSLLLLEHGQISIGELTELASELGFLTAEEAGEVENGEDSYPRNGAQF